MKNEITVALAIALAMAATSATAGVNGGGSNAKLSVDQPKLLLVGPVEAYDQKHLTARILKQTVLLKQAIPLVVGDLVSVVGSIDANGAIVASTIKDQGLYVPGSSEILLSGRIQTINASVGTAMVNGVTVDYTPLMSDDLSVLRVGSEFTVSGTQPALGGVVLAAGVNGGGMSTAGVNGAASRPQPASMAAGCPRPG